MCKNVRRQIRQYVAPCQVSVEASGPVDYAVSGRERPSHPVPDKPASTKPSRLPVLCGRRGRKERRRPVSIAFASHAFVAATSPLEGFQIRRFLRARRRGFSASNFLPKAFFSRETVFIFYFTVSNKGVFFARDGVHFPLHGFQRRFFFSRETAVIFRLKVSNEDFFFSREMAATRSVAPLPPARVGQRAPLSLPK